MALDTAEWPEATVSSSQALLRAIPVLASPSLVSVDGLETELGEVPVSSDYFQGQGIVPDGTPGGRYWLRVASPGFSELVVLSSWSSSQPCRTQLSIIRLAMGIGPAARLAKESAQRQKRWLVYKSGFPLGPGSLSRSGVLGTTWIAIDKTTYDACLDPTDYRPSER